MSVPCKPPRLPFRWVPRGFSLLILATLLAAGCAFKKDAAPPTTPAGIRENGVLVLAHADNNRTTELRVGERFQVRLPENPSTGYTWAIDEINSRLLALDGTDYTEPDEGFIGARGQRLFTFTTRQPGEVALKLKYWRFRDGDGSVTKQYAITVRIVP